MTATSCSTGGGTATAICHCRQTGASTFAFYALVDPGSISSNALTDGNSSLTLSDPGSGTLIGVLDGTTVLSATDSSMALLDGSVTFGYAYLSVSVGGTLDLTEDELQIYLDSGNVGFELADALFQYYDSDGTKFSAGAGAPTRVKADGDSEVRVFDDGAGSIQLNADGGTVEAEVTASQFSLFGSVAFVDSTGNGHFQRVYTNVFRELSSGNTYFALSGTFPNWTLAWGSSSGVLATTHDVKSGGSYSWRENSAELMGLSSSALNIFGGTSSFSSAGALSLNSSVTAANLILPHAGVTTWKNGAITLGFLKQTGDLVTTYGADLNWLGAGWNVDIGGDAVNDLEFDSTQLSLFGSNVLTLDSGGKIRATGPIWADSVYGTAAVGMANWGLQLGSNVGVQWRSIADADSGASDLRLWRTGTSAATLDDASGGSADLEVTGDITSGGTAVCLSDGTDCPAAASNFDDIGSGTNTTADMEVGSGSTLRIDSGSTGVIGCTELDHDGDGEYNIWYDGATLKLSGPERTTTGSNGALEINANNDVTLRGFVAGHDGGKSSRFSPQDGLTVHSAAEMCFTDGSDYYNVTSACWTRPESGVMLLDDDAGGAATLADVVGHVANQGEVSTTDATVTIIESFPVASDTTLALRCFGAARRTDADGESGLYEFVVRFDNDAGTTTVGASSVTTELEDTAAWEWTFAADDTNDEGDVRVQGEGSKSIDWKLRCETIEVAG